MNAISKAASLLGKIGRGESKVRGDSEHYRRLARKSHKVRRRNNADKKRALRRKNLHLMLAEMEDAK